MKKVLILCMVLVFSTSVFSSGFNLSSLLGIGKKGVVSISATYFNSNMKDVDIYVDGKKVAVLVDGPTDVVLKEGEHTIALKKPIDKYAEYKAVKKVFVGVETITRVKFELEKTLTKAGEAKQGKENEDFISKDGIVYDKRLNLTWQDNYEAKSVEKKWKEAKKYCEDLNLAGFTDWRLPSIEELSSIADMSRYKPAIRKAFKNVKSKYYWSSTSHASDSSGAWLVGFKDGHVGWYSKSGVGFVRCVR